MEINPGKPRAGEKNLPVTFRHPSKGGKVVMKSLGTADEEIARHICTDLALICNKPELWDDEESPRLNIYDPRAVSIFFDKPQSKIEERREKPVLDQSDVQTLCARILHELDKCKQAERFDVLSEILGEYESNRYGELDEKYGVLESKAKGREEELAIVSAKLAKYEMRESKHVKVKCSEAYERFEIEYPKTRKRSTVKETLSVVKRFLLSTPSGMQMQLREVLPDHVNTWISNYKSPKTGKTASQRTLHHKKCYVSAFFTFCKEEYGLFSNPAASAKRIKVSKRVDEIDHMRLTEIQSLLEALKPKPYWHTWAAFAILAGPRWGEQATLKIDAVNMDDRYITIRASKTGRQRRVPIETTTLLPILKTYLEWRNTELEKRKTPAAMKSDFLFPTILGDNPYMPRELTEIGQWSGTSAWRNAWISNYPAVKDDEKLPSFWDFGPREWRHTFGTALGQCGWTAIEISRAMGNSAQVAEDHYIAVAEAGKRWPFKW